MVDSGRIWSSKGVIVRHEVGGGQMAGQTLRIPVLEAIWNPRIADWLALENPKGYRTRVKGDAVPLSSGNRKDRKRSREGIGAAISASPRTGLRIT